MEVDPACGAEEDSYQARSFIGGLANPNLADAETCTSSLDAPVVAAAAPLSKVQKGRSLAFSSPTQIQLGYLELDIAVAEPSGSQGGQ